jgi:membrane fusion protein, multidrug efflux system
VSDSLQIERTSRVANGDRYPADRHDQNVRSSSNDDNSKSGGEHSGDDGGTSSDKSDEPKKPRGRLPIIVAVIVFILAVFGGVLYWFSTRNQESTDDAYTEGNAVSIAPKVSGYVAENYIDDNKIVHRDDLLLKIDPRDYIAARDQAQANLDAALAALEGAQNDLAITRVRAPADLTRAQAQLAQARARQMLAQRDYNRQRAVDPRATTQTEVDQADSSLQVSAATRSAAQAEVTATSLVQQTIRAAEATVDQREAQVEQTQAALAQAKLNLSYTDIRAPQDGRITTRNVDFGTYAQAGQQVFYIVTNDVWVVANFKETQLDRMRLGQRVGITVDGYPGLKLTGHVASIQAGSGARFSAFPAENATGNFVKIVRRVPVKIIIDHGLEHGPFLPLGLSVAPTVFLK